MINGINQYSNQYYNSNQRVVLQSPESMFGNNSFSNDYIDFENYNDLSPTHQEPTFWNKVSNTLSNLYNSAKVNLSSLFGNKPDISIFNSNNSVSNLVGEVFGLSNNSSLVTTKYKDVSGRPIKLAPESAFCFEKLMNIANQKGISVRVSSSYRSVDHQKKLFENAVKKYGSESAARKWVAPPGKSQHNYGYAIDLSLYKNGKKLSQSEFDKIIGQAGFYRPMSYEGWHIEPISTKGKRKDIVSSHNH